MRLTVCASKRYDIVSYPSFDCLWEELKKVLKGKKILVVSDKNVEKLYLGEVEKALCEYELHTVVFPAGEETKRMDNYIRLVETLAREEFTRSDCVLALGGGVIGDLAGYAAATYMRGVSFVQCPTSFLAMIDSSVGGKTAIDLPEGKNLVGAFYQPDLVYINVSVLKTLPKREVVCGMGEAVKYAFLDKKVTYDALKKGMTEELIFSCLEIKKNVVEADERDNGKRALLNLGHTIGHAVENLAGYSLSHGECVAKGIKKIIKMSQKYYGFSDEKREKMEKLLSLSGADLSIEYPMETVMAQTAHDKKREDEGTWFVLVRDIGLAERVYLTPQKAKELVE